MAKFQGTNNGKNFKTVEDGVQTFKILETRYDDDTAVAVIVLANKAGARVWNNMYFVNKNGEQNNTMVNSAIMLVNTVLGIKENTLDTDLLKECEGKFVTCEIYTDNYTGTPRKKVRPFSYEVALNFNGTADVPFIDDLDNL